MSSLITRSSESKQLVPGLNVIFGMAYKDISNEAIPMYDTEKSERAFEEEVMMSLLGSAPTKGEGAAIVYDDAREAWTARYTHETIALGFAITEEAFEDNLYDTFSKVRAKGLGRAMANTQQVKAAAPYNNAFSASFPTGDGVPLISASHPTRDAGLQSNLLAGQLSETAIENAFITITLEKDDRGILTSNMAKRLVIPPQLQFTADRILNSPLRNGTSDNDKNVVKGMFDMVHVNRYLTSPTAWYIRTECPNGMKHFERVALSTKTEGDFDTGNLRFKSRQRYSYGSSDWRGLYASAGS